MYGYISYIGLRLTYKISFIKKYENRYRYNYIQYTWKIFYTKLSKKKVKKLIIKVYT